LIQLKASTDKKLTKMPPKKEEPIKKVLLGRPGNNVKMGVVGLPNVGSEPELTSIWMEGAVNVHFACFIF
jgi:hypothetical protein